MAEQVKFEVPAAVRVAAVAALALGAVGAGAGIAEVFSNETNAVAHGIVEQITGDDEVTVVAHGIVAD